MAGGDTNDSRTAGSGVGITTANANTLALAWTYPTANDVSATPAVDAVNQVVYFPDWSGYLYKLNSLTGALIWRHAMTDYGFPSLAVSRSTPTLAGSALIMGASGLIDTQGGTPAYLISVDSTSGNLNWSTVLDPDPWSLVTGSPVIYNGVAYVGVSSAAEGEVNPTFRGSLVAVSLATGAILWQTYMAPPGQSGANASYTGVPIWSSTPVIDVNNGLVITTTGNNYSAPTSAEQCEQAAGNNRSAIIACQSQKNLADSIVALDINTGAIVWAFRASATDIWNGNCLHASRQGCPVPAGNDFDFGSGPNLFTITLNGQPTLVVGAGQKSGIYWLLNAQTGQLIWKTQVGPGGKLGGIQWGTAYDGTRIYVAITNSSHLSYTLQPSGLQWHGGSWAALDPTTGNILWQIPDPGFSTVTPQLPALSMGPVSSANGVLFMASMSGAMYAVDASSGNKLWSFQAAGSVNAAPAIVGNSLFWGSGYHNFPRASPVGTASNTFYSFTLPN